MPQYAIAQVGSSLIACSNDRMAAPWLKPYRNLMPCWTYFAASGLAAVMFGAVEPSPSYNGSSAAARSDEAKRATPRTKTVRRRIAFMGAPICISDPDGGHSTPGFSWCRCTLGEPGSLTAVLDERSDLHHLDGGSYAVETRHALEQLVREERLSGVFRIPDIEVQGLTLRGVEREHLRAKARHAFKPRAGRLGDLPNGLLVKVISEA